MTSHDSPKPAGASAFAANPSVAPPSVGESLWMKAQSKTVPSVKFSKSFRTLRDMMQDACIELDSLKKVDRLGEGAFATVDKCIYQTQVGFKREVAVKRLKPNVFKSELDLHDFVLEAHLLKKLSHPNIVDFIGLGADVEQAGVSHNSATPESIFVVTEFMNRGTLYSKIVSQMKAARTIYTLQEGLRWLINIARGMKYLHNSNPRVIHRDLKIENVMLTSDSQGHTVAKIGDFGLHALVPPKAENIPQSGSKKSFKLTSKRFAEQAKTIKKRGTTPVTDDVFRLSGKTGSLMYMAPEVLKSENYNEKADVYSFAIVMYEVLQKCMLLAFVSLRGIPAEVEQYIESVLSGFRPYLPSDWPAEVKNLLNRCWSGNLGDRPSMDTILEILMDIQEKGLLHEDEPKTKRRQKRCCTN